MQPQAAASFGTTPREPSPDFSAFSPEELDRLEQVLEKQVQIENEQSERLSGLRRTMLHLQQSIHHDQQRSRTSPSASSHNSSPTQQRHSPLSSSDIVHCYICASNIGVQSNNSSISLPILCADCHRPVCRRCGNYTSPEFIQAHCRVHLENRSHSSKWRCRVCIVRREVVRKSGTWNMVDNETPAHSPVRLLQKISAFRASIASTSSASSPSPQNEHKSSILAESTNFLARLWRPSPPPSSPSPTLVASHETKSSSFDHIPEACAASGRQSFSMPAPVPAPPLCQVSSNVSSLATDPSFEDTASEQPFDTASEYLSRSLDTNIDSSNPGIVDDPDDDQRSSQQVLSYDERHRRLSLRSKPMRSSAQQLSLLPTGTTEEDRTNSLTSPEASIDVSSVMDYFSISMLAKQSMDSSSTHPLLAEDASLSVDLATRANHNHRRASRSDSRNSDAWVRKRTLMQRGYEWTTTLDREHIAAHSNPVSDDDILNDMPSLPNAVVNSSTPMSTSSISDSSCSIPHNLLQRRRSSRRLPVIPADAILHFNSSNPDPHVIDEMTTVASPTEYPSQPLRENSLGNRSSRSKSIDSESSSNTRALHVKLVHTHQTPNAQSIDLSNLARRKSCLVVNENLVPQRSLDYPYIVRKTQDLSDMVRRRMLYSKITKQQQGDDFSLSLEREHVPKVPRKIIIRKDNSIEIALSKPPKLRRQTLSEEYYYGYNSEAELGLGQSSNGSSMLGVPASSSIIMPNTTDRRKTIETCENIYLHAEESSKLRARTPPSNPHRILLHRNKADTSIRTNGLGMRIIGGQECEDGSLGCFVTNILPGGPAAVQGNIEVGDQILEFNGNSLIDSTYEEVRMLQDQCGDIVQLVVQHNNIRLQISGGQALTSMEVSRHFETVPRLSSSLTRKRRNLPPLPPSLSSSFPKQFKGQLYTTVEILEVPSVKELKPILINRGRLLAQIWHDAEEMKLALTIIQAGNLPLRSNGDQPYTYITGKMLVEERGFDMFETKVIHSSNPVYNETFVFHDVETINALHLEVFIWDKRHEKPAPTNASVSNSGNEEDVDEFIGTVQLPMSEANLEDEPRWYELRDRQARKASTSNVTFEYLSAERNGSFHRVLTSLKSNTEQELRKFSTDSLLHALTNAGAKKREATSESPSSRRKHSVMQILNHLPKRKHLQRASIAGPLVSSTLFTNADTNIDVATKENDLQEHRRLSVVATQSVKLKRRISQGLLKLFDVQPRRYSDTVPNSPASPARRKLSAQFSSNGDTDDDIESPIGITIDTSSLTMIKSPRHSVISTTHPDDQQAAMRSLPLAQMPIGQLMLPFIPSSRHSSISGSRKSSGASCFESDDDIDRYFTFSEKEPDEDAANENSHVQTHTVGPGQVTPRNYENMINDYICMGQIQLGLIVTKGLLEIDVICAKSLEKVIEENTHNNPTTVEDAPPDTYVKTYLRTGTRRVQKRKTPTTKGSYNPEYHSKLKYNACNVMGRRLQVTVWQRARKFEKNHCIGEAFIQLDNLTLTQLTVAWYKLFREKLVESEFYDSS